MTDYTNLVHTLRHTWRHGAQVQECVEAADAIEQLQAELARTVGFKKLVAEQDAAIEQLQEERVVSDEHITDDEPFSTGPADDLLYLAWAVIANAGWNGMAKTEGWQDAAVRWRGDWHAYLATIRRIPGEYSENKPMMTDYTDLVRRLRDGAEGASVDRATLREAADAIEQLQAELAHMTDLAGYPPKDHVPPTN